jgi:hypothetical protein
LCWLPGYPFQNPYIMSSKKRLEKAMINAADSGEATE